MLVHGHPGWDADSSLLIVVQMLTKDPAARVGLAAVMGHPWVTSGGQDPLQSMEEAGQVVRGMLHRSSASGLCGGWECPGGVLRCFMLPCMGGASHTDSKASTST